MPELPDYAVINRSHWTKANAQYTGSRAAEAWAHQSVAWGVWHTPEDTVRMLPAVADKDVIELGCGTAYFGAWLKRLGARRVVGVDITPAQLDTARRLNEETGLGLELIEANAEVVPLPDRSFDLAVSEYGASIWCDPHLWIPEAARLLRAGGELVFLCNSPLSVLCSPDEGVVQESLQRSQLGLHRVEWPSDEDPEITFHLGHGDWLRLLRRHGFEVVDMIELFAPGDAVDHSYYSYIPAAWARKWPAEEIWRTRKR
jgi:SAM-dependent methyltransferase